MLAPVEGPVGFRGSFRGFPFALPAQAGASILFLGRVLQKISFAIAFWQIFQDLRRLLSVSLPLRSVGTLPLSPTLRNLHNSNRIPRSCSGTFFLVAFFSAATRHAGVLSSSRLLRASSGHLFQMLSWPGPFLSKFFLVFGDSIPKRCKGVHCVDLGESFPTHSFLQMLASIQLRTSLVKFLLRKSFSVVVRQQAERLVGFSFLALLLDR